MVAFTLTNEAPLSALAELPNPTAQVGERENLEQIVARLVAEQIAGRPVDIRQSITVAEVIDIYLKRWPDEVDPEYARDRKRILKLFAAFYGQTRMSDASPLGLSDFIASQKEWTSWSTKTGAMAHIKRVFSWALTMRIVADHPFRGVRGRIELKRRPMSDIDFQTLLRNSPAHFRRFILFLKLTGCRPGEAAKLEFNMIDFTRRIVILDSHKTRKRTGKPRIILLSNAATKLLHWLKMRARRPPCAYWMYHLLRSGTNKMSIIKKLARAEGYTDRQLSRARQRLGVESKRIGSTGGRGRTIYTAPVRPPRLWDPLKTAVFENADGERWKRRACGTRLNRLYHAGIIPKGLSLYQLRHRFATELIKRGVNLKVVAALLGHASINTTVGYLNAVGDDVEYLHTELAKLFEGSLAFPRPAVVAASCEECVRLRTACRLVLARLQSAGLDARAQVILRDAIAGDSDVLSAAPTTSALRPAPLGTVRAALVGLPSAMA